VSRADRTLVAEALTLVLRVDAPVARAVLETEAGLVALRHPVTVLVHDVVVRERLHTVVMPVHSTTCNVG